MSDRDSDNQLDEALEGVFMPEDAVHVVNGINYTAKVTPEWMYGYPGVEITVSFEGFTVLATGADLAVADDSRGTYSCTEFDMQAQVLAAVQKAAEKLEDLVAAYSQQRVK